MTRTLAGRYQLGEVVGRGGMSTVYRATDVMLGRTVAVKVLLAALAEEDPTYVARFEREARAAAALTHRAVVTIYDAGIDDGERFIAMEYVDGRSLAVILKRARRYGSRPRWRGRWRRRTAPESSTATSSPRM